MQINLLAAWTGILLGFLSGLTLGLFFHRDDWLGGYGSFKRRLYRLGHISFFGLGIVNLAFYLTAINVMAPGPLLSIASWGFVIGAISMPVCCLIMAHFPKTHLLFGVPVVSLLLAGAMTVLLVAQGQLISHPRNPNQHRAVAGPADTLFSTGTQIVSPVTERG